MPTFAMLVSYAVIFVLFAAYGFGLWQVYKRGIITKFNFNLGVILYVLMFLVFLIFAFTRHSTDEFWLLMGDMDEEFNIPATFESMMMALVGFAALGVVFFAKDQTVWQRAYWVLVFAVFIFFSLDEYFMIHEHIGSFGEDEEAWIPYLWIPYYIAGGLIFLVISLLAFRRIYDRRYMPVMFFIIGGLVVAAFGAVVLEILVARRECFGVISLEDCSTIAAIEEVLEKMGMGIALIGVLIYAQAEIPASRYRLAVATVATKSAVWFCFIIFAYWFLPTFELYNRVDRVEITYPDTIEVLGHRIEPRHIRITVGPADAVLQMFNRNSGTSQYFHPGDTLRLQLLSRLAQREDRPLGFSVHMLQHPDMQSVKNSDIFPRLPILQARLANLIYRDLIFLTVPRDVETPSSHALAFALWYADDDDRITIIEDVQTDLEVVAPASVVLRTIPVLSRRVDTSGLEDVQYVFDNGIEISGLLVEQDDSDDLTLRFAWSTRARLSTELVQFIHLQSVEDDAYFAFDGLTFDGRYLMRDWVPGMVEIDDHQIQLDGDIPDGQYRLLTGLYDLQSGERLPVYDEQGEPLVDWAIPLGYVDVGAGS